VIAAAAGFATGSSSGSGDAAGDEAEITPRAALSSAAVGIRVPAGWSAAPSGDPVAGLELTGTVAAARSGAGSGGRIVAGMLRGRVGPGLLPAAFRADGPAAETVRLGGGLQAYRYAGLRPGGTPVTLYVAPTTSGTASVACWGAAAAGAVCGAVAHTLRVRAARPLPLGADATAARRLSAALTALERRARGPRQLLRAARRPDSQAKAARALGRAFAAAAAATAKVRPGPQAAAATSELTAALRDLAGAYGALGGAADRGAERAYATAATSIRRAGRALNTARTELGAAGYVVGRR